MMRHPATWCRNYDQYKEEMVAFEKAPMTEEKMIAISKYNEFVERNYKMTTAAKTFSIKKRDNAPEFVFGSFGCKLEDLKAFVNDKGYINFDILKGKEGGYYVKVSDYGLKKNTTETVAQGEVLEFEEMPF